MLKGGYYMSVKVQKYVHNLAKSVVYSTSDVLAQKFEIVHDFKKENQEVFTQIYASIKDYRTTFGRLKKAITNNKIVDAARVGFESVAYSVSTGDFYAKAKEEEIIQKYSGTLMEGFDIDSEDFDFEDESVTNGDKVIATAIKKNSKIGTAITTEAIVKTGKAQMDVSKENTMLLYTQNERLINKLDGGLQNIMGFLQQSGEQNAKVQNQMNENLNKFMTSVDSNVMKLTKQMDELLEMQRNMYSMNIEQKDQKKKVGWDDIVSSNGVINIKEYAKQVKKQAFNTINESFGNMLSTVLGDGIGGEGSNMLAQLASTPFRSMMTAGIDKALGKRFDDAAKQFSNTLSNIIPDLLLRANAYGKKGEGLSGILGKILGIKPSESAQEDLGKYKKGPIPFDGVTKRSIVEVIPTYLRKIASAISGQEEMVYDFNTGKWTTITNVHRNVSNIMSYGRNATANLLRGVIEQGTNRSMATTYSTRKEYEDVMKALESLGGKVFSAGSVLSLKESDLTDSKEKMLYETIKRIYAKGIEDKNGKGGLYTTRNGRQVRTGRVDIAGANKQLRDIIANHNAGIKKMNESDIDVARYALAMNLGNVDPKNYFGTVYRTNNYGDMDKRQVQELPTSQAILRARDEYGVTLYQYLRNIAANIDLVRGNSDYLQYLKGARFGGKKGRNVNVTVNHSSLDNNTKIDFGQSKQADYREQFYDFKFNISNGSDAAEKADRNYEKALKAQIERRRKAGKDTTIVTETGSYVSDSGAGSMSQLVEAEDQDAYAKAIVEFDKRQKEARDKKWKTAEEWIGKERVDKLKKIDSDYKSEDGFIKNIKKAKSVTEGLFIMGKYISSKTAGSVSDKAADTIIKVDSWLRRLVYGETVKPADQQKSFLELMKENVKEYFEEIKETISKGMDKIKEKISPFTDKIKDFFGNIFGEVDSTGNVTKEGIFAPFVSGFRRGLRKNSEDVYKWTKEQAREAKEKLAREERNASNASSTEETPTLATGGINLTGRAIPSILSRGELVNGRAVPKLGVYNIPKGATVINPASPSTRRIQSIQEKAFRNKLAANAETNDELTPIPTAEQIYQYYKDNGTPLKSHGQAKKIRARMIQEQADRIEAEKKAKQKEELDKAEFLRIASTDWNSLTDEKEKSMFLGNLASRGVIGGAIGLLAGGPILGAAIGAASTLSKSTNGFSNFIFGTAIRDADGNALVDENGNIKREADGLISEKIQKAVPDIKKLGAAGLIGGLITPLGPLGGILIGSALGYAKNSETFQGTIFGEDGIFSKKNTDKLKKGAKNIGAGAIIGALAMPGPFGLLGSALIGATAGYVTSTNKFKDFLLGEMQSDGKRRGGVVGTLKDQVINPLKDFGHTITDKLMDEIFGVEGDDGKRNGDDGLFGAIRANVIRPMTEGAQSIFKELTNKLTDIADFAKDTFKNLKAAWAGNDFLGGMFEKATGLATGVIRGAGAVGRLATKPFRLLGDEGIGGRLKAKRIRTGRADDMTARERLMYRGKLGMSEIDTWSGVDEQMTKMSKDEMQTMLNILDFDSNEGKIDSSRNNAYDILGQQLREIIPRRDVKKIIALIKNGKFRDAEKFIRTRSYSDEIKQQALNIISEGKTKIDKIEQDFDKMKKSGMTAQEFLLNNGITIDISDAKKKRYLQRMANRELVHYDAGLTEDEKEWQKQYDFWSGDKSPLNPIEQNTSAIETVLKGIYYELAGSEYDKKVKDLDSEIASMRASGSFTEEELEQHRASRMRLIGNRSDYERKLDAGRTTVAGRVIANAIGGKDTKDINATGKFGKTTAKSIREGKFISNDLINDYLPFYTGHLKDTISPDDRLDYLSSEFDSIMSTACSMFDMLALKVLANSEAVDDDVRMSIAKIQAKYPDKSLEEVTKLVRILRRNNIIVTGNGNNTYTFSMRYRYENGTVIPTEKQPSSFDEEKTRFVEDYMKAHLPKEVLESDQYLSLGKMLKVSLKFGAYFTVGMLTGIAGGISVPLIDYVIKHRKDIKKKVKKVASKIGFNAKMFFGSHEIDNQSNLQKIKNEKYKEQAHKEWTKALRQYFTVVDKIKNKKEKDIPIDDYLEEMAPIGYIIKELYPDKEPSDYALLSPEEQKKVKDKFIDMYVQAKINGQSFGRGVWGTTKHIAKKIIDKIKNIKPIAALRKQFAVLSVSKQGTYEEKAERLKASLRKRAENILKTIDEWYNYFPSNGWEIDKEAEKLQRKILSYRDIIVEIIRDLFPDKKTAFDVKALNEKEYKEFRDVFVDRFVAGRYNDLLKESNEGIVTKIAHGIRNFATKKLVSAGQTISRWKDNIINDIKTKKITKAFEKAVNRKDPTVETVASEMFSKPLNELTDSEQLVVARRWYEQYGKNRLLRKITFAGSSALGTLKSGIKNSVAGKLDYARKKKEELQAQDTLLAKFLDKLDARQLKKDRETFKGKKDSKLTKILKWLFIGGIAVPLIVGFVKQDLLPAIKEKVKPWLAKAKDKIFGVKDKNTGEYKGGVISGIVNPIRNLFKSKLDAVHDWIHNEGKYTSEDTGLRGFWQSLSKIGSHVIDLWKAGFKQVYGTFVPKVLIAVGKNIIPGIGYMIKGLGEYLGNIITKKQGALDIDLSDFAGESDSESDTISERIPDTVGGYYTVTKQVNITSKIGEGGNKKSDKGSDITKEPTNGEVNSNGEPTSVTYKNESTGKTAVSKTDGDYYSIGKDANGVSRYIDQKTGQVYVKDKESGSYVPLGDYEQVSHEDLANNREFQYQQEVEANNAYQADYTTASNGQKVAGLIGKNLVKAGNILVLDPTNGTKALTIASRGLSLPGKIASHMGVGGKLAGGLSNGIIKASELATKPVAFVHGKAMTALGKVGDVISGNRVSQIGAKVEEKLAARAAANSEKILKETMLAEAAAKKAAAKKAFKAQQLTEKIASGKANIFEKAINFLKNSISKMKEKIASVLKSSKVAKLFGKGLKENADEIAEKTAKTTVEALEGSSEEIAKKGGSVAAKGAAKIFSAIMMIADFLIGVDNCRNLLGIVSPNPTIGERITGGLINIIPDIISTIGQAITVGTGGAGAVVGGILFAISVLATIVISFESIRDKIVGGVIDILDKCGLDMSEIKQKREEAVEAVKAYNTKYNTNVSIEEYNNIIGNKTVTSKIGDAAKDAWSSMFGYDSATKSAIKEGTADLEVKGESDKINSKMATIFSSIWQYYGEEDFSTDQTDAEGNALTGSSKENANKLKFTRVANTIIRTLNQLVINDDEETIERIVSNCSDFTGPWDASHHLKKVYEKGRKNPNSQFNVQEEYADWKKIKAIAGVCAVVNEIYAPLGRKGEVTAIVVDCLIPAYFSKDEKEKVGDMTGIDTTKYNLDMSSYDGSAQQADMSSSGGSESGDDFVGPKQLAMNANANDKLSSLNKGTDFQSVLANNINDSINSITGGMKGIGDIIKELTQKNLATNKKIDKLELLPTDDDYWNVQIDDKNPFASSMYTFMEQINRVVKAPFALAAAMNAATAANVVSVSSSSSTSPNATKSNTNNGNNNNATASTNSGSENKSFLQKAADAVTGFWGKIKNWFTGKGKDDNEMGRGLDGISDASDPFHIYQRQFKGSYNTAGDKEHQTVADSGCGPASAASVLRMYGKKGSMDNAVKFALHNKYKEKDGGTYPEYFSHYFAKNGIKSNSNASNEEVINNLAHGKPVVLMGQDRSGSKKTPYGSKYSHYVVARGIDKNGNVIVEDSEDRRGSTRYSLADTLKNTSVRITTSGRGDDDEGVGTKYIKNTSSAIAAMTAMTLGQYGIYSGTTYTASSDASGSTDSEYAGTGDAAKMIGKGLSIKDSFGRTFSIKITEDEAELYDILTSKCKFNSAVACGIISNWEVECGLNTIRKVACKGRVTYGGGLMQWTPPDKHIVWANKHGYGSDPWSWEANKAHAIAMLTDESEYKYLAWKNPTRANPSLASKGLKAVSSMDEFRTLKNPEDASVNYERVFEVSFNWDGKTSENVKLDPKDYYDYPRRLYSVLLYNLIVNGKCTENGDSLEHNGPESVYGRGKSIADMIPSESKFGKGVFGRDGEDTSGETTTTTTTTTPTDYTSKSSGTDNETESEDTETTTVNSKDKDPQAKGLINLLSKYAKAVTKGIFGNFYDALYGSQPVQQTSNNNGTDDNTPVVKGGSFDIDADTTIICGDSITLGLHNGSPMGERALGLGSGGTMSYNRSIKSTGESYETIFKNHADIIKRAKNVIFFWGMNELEPGMDRDAYVDQYQNSIDTILGYAGKKASDYNVCIMSVVPVPENNTYKIPQSRVINYNTMYSKWVAHKKGYTYIDIYDACLEKKGFFNASGDIHPNPQALYEVIKETLGSGSGRGKAIIKKYSGKAKYGRDGEETTTTTTTPVPVTDSPAEDTTTTEDTTTNTTSKEKDPYAKTFINKFTKYLTAGVKGVYGNFYDAVYGSVPISNTTGDNNVDTNTGSISGSKSDILYAAAMTFDGACSHMEQNSRIARDQTINNIKCKDGTIINTINVHCNGMMCAIIHYMGYYTVRSSNRSYSESYQGDSWGAANSYWDAGDRPKIYDADGNLSNDWIYVTPSSPSDVQPGDISLACLNGPHMDMYAYTSSGGDRGYNGGANESLQRSYQLAKYYLEHGTFPSEDLGAVGTLRSAVKLIRYVGRKGSGRGKRVNYELLNAKIPVINASNKPAIIHNSKYGRALWGRDVDEETTSPVLMNPTDTPTTDDTENAESTVNSKEKINAKVLISKLSKYTKAGIKGVYGNFYDAIYGSSPETEYGTEDDSTGSAAYKGGDVVYAAAMVFEALYKADPSLRYDASFNTLNTLVCRDGTKLERQRPDCSGMMCSVIEYMGYYTPRIQAWPYTDTFRGTGWDLGMITPGCDIGKHIFNDENGTPSNDWEVIPFDPNDKRPGDIRFHSGHRHTDMYIFEHNGHDYGVNAGSGDCGGSIGNGMYNSYLFGKFYLDNGRLPNDSEFAANANGSRGTIGTWCIQPNETRCVLRYKGKQSGSGRGKERSANYLKNTIGAFSDNGKLSNEITKAVINSEAGSSFGYGKAVRKNSGKGIFDKMDDTKAWVDSWTNDDSDVTTTGSKASTTSSSVVHTSANYGTTSSIDLAQMIDLIKIIATNSDKINSIIALLGAIATNTENTTTAVNSSSAKPKESNALSALRSALSNSGSGADIINAVYKIAQS
jgi:hypothetical protein